jgi:hypothetical protein
MEGLVGERDARIAVLESKLGRVQAEISSSGTESSKLLRFIWTHATRAVYHNVYPFIFCRARLLTVHFCLAEVAPVVAAANDFLAASKEAKGGGKKESDGGKAKGGGGGAKPKAEVGKEAPGSFVRICKQLAHLGKRMRVCN